MGQTRLAPFDWDDPDWKDPDRVHNWKNYAGDWLKEVWPSLSQEQKKAVASSLDDIAAREDWE